MALLRIVNPTTGKPLGTISAATEKDVDIAVKAARKAYDNSWGLKVNGSDRGKLMIKLAELIEKNADELAALESVNNGAEFIIDDVIFGSETQILDLMI